MAYTAIETTNGILISGLSPEEIPSDLPYYTFLERLVIAELPCYTKWESEFISSVLSRRPRILSEKQKRCIIRIWIRYSSRVIEIEADTEHYAKKVLSLREKMQSVPEDYTHSRALELEPE